MASPTKHALLSASSSARWLTCTPSARFAETYEKEKAGTSFSEEGTAAHAMAEIKLKGDIKKITPSTCKRYLKKFRKDNKYWSVAFEEAVDDYVGFVNEMMANYEHPDVVLEQKVDFSEWVPEGFGTSDVVIMTPDTLHIVDLKFGKGVPVTAIENTQLMLYALGTYNEFGIAYDFKTVKITIHQPRLHDVSTYELPLLELLNWGDSVVKPRAELAMKGEGEFTPSEKACRFCAAKAFCKARANQNLQDAIKYDFADSNKLTEEELADILSKSSEIKKWLTEVEDYALEKVRDHEGSIPGYKLVEGRSIRKLIDTGAVSRILQLNGYTNIYKPTELLTMTALEKMVGKTEFNDILGEYIVKPKGKPTLVPENDKRPEISSIQQAIRDFSE